MSQRIAARGGRQCGGAGADALARLAALVAVGESPRVRALDLGSDPVAPLPGATVLVGRGAIAEAADPSEIAGWIALALAREDMRPEAERLMAAVGPAANLRYVLTGRLSAVALARAAEAAAASATPEEVEAAYVRLRGAGLATAPFATALRRRGLAAPPSVAEGTAALSDQEWVALREQCG